MNQFSPQDKKLRHVQKIEQKQKLSPRQILQIRITQIPRLELEHLIYQEIESNLMLEFVEEEELNEEVDKNTETLEDELHKELGEFFDEDYPSLFSSGERDDRFEKQIPYRTTLSEDLKSELRLETSDNEMIKIGNYIIDSLDNNGFLNFPVESIAEYLGVKIDKVDKTLNLIQSFNPPGIGARNPRESLILKMERNRSKWENELNIVRDCWDSYIKKDIKEIEQKLNMDEEKIKKSIQNLENLNIHPSRYGIEEIRYVIPTVIVKKKGEDFEISINEPTLPYFRLNSKYLNIIQSPENYDKKTVNFVKKWLDRAIFILRCLEMRKKNFRAVAKYMIEKQHNFIKDGILHMQPLKLSDIAEATELSESTISRYIKDTYVQTQGGVFPMKLLLSGGIDSEDGFISTNVIREKIKIIIENEGKEPLTDDVIKDLLQKEGIDISRRTIAKYRNQMGISSSRKRKKEKIIYE